MLFGRENRHTNKFRVDLGDLQSEKEHLSSFLQSKLKVTITPKGNKLTVNSEKLTAQKLHHAVNKFIYHQKFNSTHWVSTEGTTVKINKFKGKDKAKKNKKDKKNTNPHQTAMQSWGL